MLRHLKLFKNIFYCLLVGFSLKGHCETFTDESLHKLIKEQQSGMILVWSQGMPLSILMLQEAPAIATALKLSLTPITHENMRSEELAAHGILNHFPAIMIFRDGHLQPFLFQGYEVSESLIKILKEHL